MKLIFWKIFQRILKNLKLSAMFWHNKGSISRNRVRRNISGEDYGAKIASSSDNQYKKNSLGNIYSFRL